MVKKVSKEKMNRKELIKYSYLAGIIDGEGHFCLSESKVVSKKGTFIRAYPKIIVGNKDKDLILWLKKEFGGYFNQNNSIYKGEKYILYNWIITNEGAINIIKKIKNFLIVKKLEIPLILGGIRTFYTDKYGTAKFERYKLIDKEI